MLYLVFSSESDYTDAGKYFVSVWPSLNDAIEAIDHLAEEPWGQYRFWWVTSTMVGDPYNFTTSLVRSPERGT